MSWVWEHSPTTGSHRLVLLAIADAANDEGIAWPSISTLATKANLGRRYVIDILQELESQGAIHKTVRRVGPKNRSNLYRVLTDIPCQLGFQSEENEPETPGVVNQDSPPLVNQASPGSEPGLTRGSEPETTRVVSQGSPNPLKNLNKEPSLKRKGAPPRCSSVPIEDLGLALAEVCHLDYDLNAAECRRMAVKLFNRGYTGARIRAVYGQNGSWWTDHWLGRDKREFPTLVGIPKTIQVLEHPPNRPRAETIDDIAMKLSQEAGLT
ncbi:MAG: helix-turn-helix domain-containing protein [Anaerolineaceae bacterium]|nr:helix-turn-helix domain-containing protein [Anaerolineaceae bacterium]MDD5367538.1 helix-turn-helix domain-containing protein [Anaerolineaceae bacterium]